MNDLNTSIDQLYADYMEFRAKVKTVLYNAPEFEDFLALKLRLRTIFNADSGFQTISDKNVIRIVAMNAFLLSVKAAVLGKHIKPQRIK